MTRATEAGKGGVWRLLSVLVATCTLATFILSEWALLHRAFGNYRLPHLIGLSAVVICAYARASWESPLKGAIRAGLASWAGSVAGYLMTVVAFYADGRLTRSIELEAWLFVTMVWAYLRTDGWALGLALALPSLIAGVYRGLRPTRETPLA